jgi:hypothetical protein
MQHGGKEYGAGKYGRTIDAAQIDGDDDTMHACLISMSPELRRKCYAWAPNGRTRVLLTLGQFDALVKFTARATDVVAKHMHSDVFSDAKSAFVKEIRTNALVLAAYGTNSTQCTTLRNIKIGDIVIAGLETPEAYYILSGRCEVPLNRFKFNSDSIDSFVCDILKSFDCLHRADMLHCDVALDNMIHCSREGRFKLIDWGLSETQTAMRKRYVTQERPKNTGSPMAWLAWGTGPASSLTYMTFYFIKRAYYVFTCHSYQQMLVGAKDSFNKLLEESLHADKERLGDDAFRRMLVKRYARSFDLFSLGFVFSHLACSVQRVSERRRAALLTLSRRFTHYGDADFMQDAGEALEWWKTAR